MSEYQYYEFRAVDRPLTPQQQAELRSRSSRAAITATSFINEYHWGDLKGNPLDWMRRYFDAHVYSANWGSCDLMLRLPLSTLDKAMLEPFIRPSQCDAQSGHCEAFQAIPADDHWIVHWSLNDDPGELERFWNQDGPGWMGSLLPLRDELLRGDTRPLYIGWLARLSNEELGDDDIEPPLPAGLNSLTPAQIALTEFLAIDPDWLAAAAEASPALPDRDTADPLMDDFIALQTLEAMQITTRLLLEGRSLEAERALRQRYLDWRRDHSPQPPSCSRRTVAEINAVRETVTARRLELERQRLKAEQAKRRAERKQQLERLAADSNRVWANIDQTLQRGSGNAYDEALQILKDLAEAMTQAGRKAEFQAGLEKLLSVHGKRNAWMKRLAKAGIQAGAI